MPTKLNLDQFTGHSGGPWIDVLGGLSTKRKDTGLIRIYAANDDLETICDVRQDKIMFHGAQNHEANAKLIAAAPELLEMCRRQNELLREAILQIDRLHDRFGDTFSGNEFIARIEAELL